MLPRARTFIAICLAAAFVACGSGPSEADVVRSQREYELGASLVSTNPPQAFDHLLDSVRLDPNNYEAHFLLGTLFMVRRNHPDAERHLRRALAIRGRYPEARNSLGMLYISMHRYDDAIRELRVATRDIRYHTPWLAWGNLGWAYLERGRNQDAIEALLQAVRSQPAYCFGFYLLGQAYFRSEQLERADEALTQAVEVDQDECRGAGMQDAWLLRARVRLQIGEAAAAVSDLQRCVEISERTPIGIRCQRLLDETQENVRPDTAPPAGETQQPESSSDA
ncbi:MAG: tetratricopeptide repeat protein [Deltaproteobacteria bacterium]|nr:tetratricopeptide repeat protein [Deltaproteobacteria bacterium]